MPEFNNAKIKFEGNESKCVVTFNGSHNASLLTIKADGVPVGMCALCSSGDVPETAECPIDSVDKGVHEISVELDGSAGIHSLEFSSDELYKGVSYEPTPLSNLRNVRSETWEATDMLGRRVASVEDVGGVKDRKVMDCIECRCCEYICSSKIPLVSKIQAGKGVVRGMK